MKKSNSLFFAIGAIILTITTQSCDDKITPTPSNETGALTIEFEHKWGINEEPFLYGSPIKHPMSGDTLTTNLLKYYISNVELVKADGSKYVAPNSYYLIDPNNNTLELNNIPKGEYTGINFLIGVDSLHNCSGVQEGVLSPSNGMFWSWSSGYIFVRIEGKSNLSPTGNFLYHLGGYQGPYNAIRAKNLTFGSAVLSVNPAAKPTVHLITNVAKLWHGPVKTADLSILHMIGADASMLATNFASGIRFDHIHP